MGKTKLTRRNDYEHLLLMAGPVCLKYTKSAVMPTHLIWIAYSITNLVALFMLLACWRNRAFGRLLFFLLFAGAAAFNARTALLAPEQYIGYAQYTVLSVYREFILGFFARHTTFIVLLIAAGQAGIALGMLGKARLFRLGAIGGILFLLGISPLGAGSAFPAPLMLAAGLGCLWWEGSTGWLWKSSIRGTSPRSVDLSHKAHHA